jgi:hypothetical protein
VNGPGVQVKYSIALVGIAACAAAEAEPPPYQREISSWASGTNVACRAIELQGNRRGTLRIDGSVCWSAKSRTEQPPKGS